MHELWLLTLELVILRVFSAEESKIESSGDQARHETGSSCSAKVLATVKPAYESDLVSPTT